LTVALLVGFVGIFGITSNATIVKNNESGIEVGELLSLVNRLLIQVLQLIETQTLDEYRDIKSSIETTRKDFDVLHRKSDELIHSIKGFEELDQDIEEFTKISNGIIAIHKEKLVRQKDFDEKAVLERDLRRDIRTPLFALNDAALVKDVGSMQYKSKEALYQYKDQKHVDEWLGTIEKVKSRVEDSILLQDIDSYQLLSQGMGEIVVRQKEAEEEEHVKIKQLREVINKLENTERKLITVLRSESVSLTRNTRLALLIAAMIAFILSVVLGSYISRSISKPVENLSQIAQSIAAGDLTKRAKVTSKDEIGQLAITFNGMAGKLKELYEGLEGKVRARTEELRKEKDKAVTILQGIGDGVFAVDTNHRITMFNRAAVVLSGFAAREAVGQRYDTILKFVSEEDEKINHRFIREAMTTGTAQEMSNPTVLIRKDGKRIPVADSAAPLKDKGGNVIGCVVVFRDVTKEREIDRAKSEFVSLASHQLRTPLSTVNWYAEMLLEEDTGKSKEAQRRYLEKIYRNNQRMVGLVNALLNVSRIELGTLVVEPEPTDLQAVAKSALEELSLQIKDKKLEIRTHYSKDLPIVILDPKLMRIVFQNLLSNSVKYTSQGGKVDLVITKQKIDVLIRVSDTGQGIPKAQQSKIFTKLFRADNARIIDPDGTGLGLYIVKSVIEQFGGKIWFESEKNKGTTFYTTIPLAGMKHTKKGKGLA